MNKKVLRNKAFLMSHAIDRKKMYKVGSQWVIGSALVLLLAGGASLAHHATANADNKTPVEQSINQYNKNSSTKVIQKPTVKIPASNPKPTFQSNGSASNKGMTARAQQARSWNFVQHGVNNHDYDNYQAPKKPTSSVADVKSINRQASNMYGAIKSNNNGNQAQSFANKPNTKVPKIRYSLTESNPVISMSSSNNQYKKANQITNKHMLGGAEKQPLKKTTLGVPANTTNESKIPWMNAYLSNDGTTLTITGDMSDYNGNGINNNAKNPNGTGTSRGKNSIFPNVTTLNLGNVTNFTNARFLFANMPKLTTINQVGNWNTSNVNDMGGMFLGDTSLANINALANWNTSNVNNMICMFYNDTNLSNIDTLANWNTSNVNNMSAMFLNDTSLSNIDALANWNTSNVNNMNYMFGNLFTQNTKLSNLAPLANWNTSNVNNMIGMFTSDTRLINKTPISNWSIAPDGTPNESMNNGNGGKPTR